MKNEYLAERPYFLIKNGVDQEELSEVDACTVARARAEEKLSIVTKLILTNAVPLALIAAASDLPIEEVEKIKKELTTKT